MRVRTVLLLGIAVREAFSFWTGHPFDFEIWVRTGYWVVRGLSPYAPLPFAPGVSFANDFGNGNNAAIGYLPFWPLLLGAIYEVYSVLGSGNPLVYYFLLKQPVILADVAMGYLLFSYIRRKNEGIAPKVLALWLFSPVTIIISAIWGTFDSMSMLCVMMALLAPAGRVRSAWDGVAAFVKSIPVIFVLPISYSRENRWANLALALGIPVLSTVLIVYLAGWPVTGQHYTVLTTLENTLQVYGYPLSLWGTWVFLSNLNVLPNSVFLWVLGWPPLVRVRHRPQRRPVHARHHPDFPPRKGTGERAVLDLSARAPPDRRDPLEPEEDEALLRRDGGRRRGHPD